MTFSCSFKLLREQEEGSTVTEDFIVYPQRWWTLASYSMLSCSSAWLWITWAPLATSLTKVWDVPLSAVDALSGVYMYVYVPCSFISLYLVVNQLGLQKGLILGGILNAAGAWIRYVHYDNYQMVYVGTFVCAFAQTFTLSTPPLIAGSWFGENERATATALGILANQLGTAFGLGATIVVDFFDPDIVIQPSQSNSGVAASSGSGDKIDESVLASYLKFQFTLACVALVAVSLSVRDHPPTPPSLAAAAVFHQSGTNPIDEIRVETGVDNGDAHNASQDTTDFRKTTQVGEATSLIGLPSKKMDSAQYQNTMMLDLKPAPTYVESIYVVVQNVGPRVFVLCFGLAVGVYYTVPTFLAQLFPGRSPRTIGYLGVLYQVLGVIGSFISGRIMDITHGHRKIALFCLLGSGFCLLLCCFQLGATTSSDNIDSSEGRAILWSRQWMWIGEAVSIGLAGVFLSAFNTVGIELGTGMVFPADESAVAGILESAAELGGFLFVTAGGSFASSSQSSFPASNLGDHDSQGDANSAHEKLLLLLACSSTAALVLMMSISTKMARPSIVINAFSLI